MSDERYGKILGSPEPVKGSTSTNGNRRTGVGATEATPRAKRPANAVRMTSTKRPVTYKLPEDVIELVKSVVRQQEIDGYKVAQQDVVAEAIRGYWGTEPENDRD